MDPLTYGHLFANGLEFRVAQANPGGERGLALLLHGFPELAFSWRFQIPLLADMGYEVWAPDLRGYGESGKPEPISAYDLDHLVADVAALIDLSGRDRVTLVGHDWGGMIAWETAIRRTRPLERLIVMNIPHPACMRRELRRLRQLRRSWYMFFFRIPWLPETMLKARRARAIGRAFERSCVDPSRFPEDVTDVYRAAAVRPRAMESMLNYYRAAFRSRRVSAGEEPAVIETPTLMLWGLQDTALGRETTDGTDRYVRDLTLRFIPSASHWVQQEVPEIVNAMMRAWLDGEVVPEADEIDAPRLPDPAIPV